MSRIIIKGLPSDINENRLHSLFSEKGQITDCSLKYTKEGVFRKFAFIGYSKSEEADNAVKYFNHSFIDTSKIIVEIAKDFGDEKKPRAWSKYSRDSSAYQKMMEKLETKKEKEKKEIKKKKSKIDSRTERLGELFGDLKDNPEFQEFLSVHQSSSNKKLWENDTLMQIPGSDKVPNVEVKGQIGSTGSDSGMSDSRSSENENDHGEASEKDPSEKLAANRTVSDKEYLKSIKSGKSQLLSESEDSDSQESEESSDDEDSDERESLGSDMDNNVSDEEDSDHEEINVFSEAHYVIKMRGLPNTAKEKQIKEFFQPLEVKKIKIPKNARGKSSFMMATVEFKTEKDTEQAMRRNKNYIGPKKILLYKVKKDVKNISTTQEKTRPWEEKLKQKPGTGEEEDETIAESGRLFVRNLAYCCKEEDLEATFGIYGPLTEVHLPVDTLTKKVKGFAFITFMIPEHAVKAFSELDGTVFQGRMLHILPGKVKVEDEVNLKEGSSYKKQKEAKQKALAGSSHNWNTLFLGANAVADVMAEKYGKTKGQILDIGAKESLGVRMALGETQIVAETREFLIENGVALDSFSQASGPRSKTVMLAKNLPAGTTKNELEEMFSKHGTIGQLILPSSGITAIVEYLEPSEARSAFKRLAYTKFKHIPLYLEWAPHNIFVSKKSKEASVTADDSTNEGKTEERSFQNEKAVESETEGYDDEQSEPETILFVKNLNFDTTEESLREKFANCGHLRNVSIAKKKDMKHAGKMLSMGYGFVEFKKRKSAQKAMKTLQHTMLDNHQLELKISNRTTTVLQATSSKQKQDSKKKQTGTKILVRNIPFEAKDKEIRELFSVFGELKTVRLPKKLSGTGSHRGFGFVDFLTKQDAKRAFNALCHSTHMYGRRMVLEWADTDESVDQLRLKTAQHFHEGQPSKKLKKSDLKEDLEASMDK